MRAAIEAPQLQRTERAFSDFSRFGEASIVAEPRPSVDITPFNNESFIMQLGQNEWVVTQPGASLPGEPTYGKDSPLAMRAWHAPNAGEKARAILETGRRPDIALSAEREATFEELRE